MALVPIVGCMKQSNEKDPYVRMYVNTDSSQYVFHLTGSEILKRCGIAVGTTCSIFTNDLDPQSIFIAPWASGDDTSDNGEPIGVKISSTGSPTSVSFKSKLLSEYIAIKPNKHSDEKKQFPTFKATVKTKKINKRTCLMFSILDFK